VCVSLLWQRVRVPLAMEREDGFLLAKFQLIFFFLFFSRFPLQGWLNRSVLLFETRVGWRRSLSLSRLIGGVVCLTLVFFVCSVKVVLIGDSAVGKSNLLSRFTRNEFNLET
jgi:hypothetical protein